MYRLAKLSEQELSKIQEYEKELERLNLVAYQRPPQTAELTDDQLKKIKELEEQLGLVLVAYR